MTTTSLTSGKRATRLIGIAALLAATTLGGCGPLDSSSVWVGTSLDTSPSIPYYGPYYSGSIWNTGYIPGIITYPTGYVPPRPRPPHPGNPWGPGMNRPQRPANPGFRPSPNPSPQPPGGGGPGISPGRPGGFGRH